MRAILLSSSYLDNGREIGCNTFALDGRIRINRAKKRSIMNIVLLITEDGIVGREILKQFGEAAVPITSVLVERSKRADREKDYLKNDLYDPPSFSELIERYPTPVTVVPHLNKEESEAQLRELKPDIILLCGSVIIKPHIFSLSRIGTINAHPGLLPEYKGLDSVRWAIYHNDPVGATSHFVDEGLDTGPVLVRKEVQYRNGETILDIRVRAMRVCVEVMLQAVRGLTDGTLTAKPQQEGEGRYFSWAPEDVKEAVDAKLSA
jgi:methionyl-tRNA formyltransferase